VQEILTLVAAGKGVCLVPLSVAREYPRTDVAYIEVTDADAAVVSLAWPQANLRPVVAAFIEATRKRLAEPDALPGAAPAEWPTGSL
jgi:DNA-binding transcriptional LysR family regulator